MPRPLIVPLLLALPAVALADDDIAQLPAAVEAAVLDAYPGARIVDREAERDAYEVELRTADGYEIELHVAADGTILFTEHDDDDSRDDDSRDDDGWWPGR